jgi:hypothetical protein
MTHKLAHELFEYKQGVLYWKGKNRIAGHLDKSNGYIRIRYKEGFYYSHRIIYLMHNGYMPEYIDHIDGCKTNNAISNLRECTQQQNCYNRKMSKNNKLGYKGISIHKRSGLFRAVTYYNKKQKLIGYFKNLSDAVIAYNNYINQIHGNFANLNQIHNGEEQLRQRDFFDQENQ